MDGAPDFVGGTKGNDGDSDPLGQNDARVEKDSGALGGGSG
jgi:hypothetical protein